MPDTDQCGYCGDIYVVRNGVYGVCPAHDYGPPADAGIGDASDLFGSLVAGGNPVSE